MIWLLFCAFILGGDSLYQEFYSGDLTCTGQPTVKYVPNRACGSDSNGPEGECVNFLGLNITGAITSCPETVVMPRNWATLQGWSLSETCAGFPDYTIAIPPNTCSGYWDGPTMQLDCANSAIKECLDEAPLNGCENCPSKPANASGLCVVGNPTSNFPMIAYIFTCPCFETPLALSTSMGSLGFPLLLFLLFLLFSL